VNSGWSAFSFDQQDLDHQRKSELTRDLDPSFGLFNLSNKQSDRNQQSFLKIAETAIKVECQLMQVHIERNWLNPLVLSSRNWRMDKNSPEPDLSLSSGADLEKGILPVGEMTLLPVSAIICKNLRVNGHFENDVVQKINEEMERGVQAVGFGPFAIADKRYGQNQRARGTITNQIIEVADEQIIGIICKVLPKMPNPNPELPWKK
jgi:hypothetical protein